MMTQIPISVQMYTLRDECEKDFLKTLNKVAEIGFDGVEFAGYYGVNPADLRKYLDELNLRASGSHFVLKEMEENLDFCIEAQAILGSRHLIIAYPYDRMEKEEEYHELAAKLNGMGKKVHEAGLTLSYHHHEFELLTFGQRTGMEILMEETNPEWVQFELDIYWLTHAGKDPADWIKRYSDRVSLVHMKDMETGEDKAFAELGAGILNLKAVVEEAGKANAEWLVVEQDICKRSPLESVSASYSYLKGLSIKI
ncbi:sugar phosphate isomerase/epimerase [Bacillus sp. FJAT-42376]|uniref:sugar phosphate isomerase/epimerase family protein n=1 Tax=Bacillus sp. FJAT-42376 TaxID=2014076 RepID=UPI000F4EE76A|nr:sugar phosphate isomerase/epimerase [Bacillus sp. FJAT-42376]AZB44144.1 sugar phosphate isomerase/epimerase [Bacillus sp. FJAT-42376]